MGTAMSVESTIPRKNIDDLTRSNMVVLLLVMFATEDTEITEVFKVVMTSGTSGKYVGFEIALTLNISHLFFSVYSVLSVAIICRQATPMSPAPNHHRRECCPE